ncbi:MAG: hypothetical protein KJ550_03855 [Proteobacteria bacterium]|nr:hypothetical protein [Pseudomonadota bacterium]MBU4068301.1 hypothetical protein [Pseudomonadota bacterium]
MKRLNYFFKREEFKSPDVKKPFYEYLGYFVEKSDGTKLYPLSIYFGKDEISVSFTDVEGRIHKVFSLYVAEGELNQKKLSSQIENYWKMPIWPLKKDVGELLENGTEESESNLQIDPQLLSSGAFGKYFGINISDDHKFVEDSLFKESGKKKDFEIINEGRQVRFPSYKKNSEEIEKEKWELKREILTTNKINFRKILLDFLFELEFASTFEDKNFFQLQPVLQDNKVLDALTRKCTYLLELYHLKNYQQETKKPNLPIKFKNPEKAWLNVCFLESYKDVFASRNSIFKSQEEEAELVLFKTRIGASSRDRSDLFTKDDVDLRNQSATFFLRNYSIYNAFRTLLHPAAIYLLPVLLLLIPFGDFGFNLLDAPAKFVGLSSIGIPIVMLATLVAHYKITGINLFKLVLPRLFLGIMLGWSVLSGTEELWKSAIIATARGIFVVNSVLFVLIYLYVFTDIKNKLVKLRDNVVFRRAGALVLFAMLISFVQGFYVMQYQAKPMLENSGFLKSDNPKLFGQKKADNIKDIKITGIKQLDSNNSLSIGEITHRANVDSKDNLIEEILGSEHQKERALLGIENFTSMELFTGTKFYYIWSVHLSQFMVSILIGIVLQLLWEDRPITEPL